MKRKERKISESDLYITNPSLVHYGALFITNIIIQIFNTIKEDDWAPWIMLFICIIAHLPIIESFAKRIEIHEDEIVYRNYFWITKRYQISNITLIDTKNGKSSRIIVYGKEGKKLFTMHELRNEILLAISYLQSKGVELGNSLKINEIFQLEEPYEKVYQDKYQMAEKMALGWGANTETSLVTNLSSVRLRHINKISKPIVEKNKKDVKQVLCHWGIKHKRIKPYVFINCWKAGKKVKIYASSELEKSIQRSKLIELYEKEDMLADPVIPTLKGNRYHIENGMYFEAFRLYKSKEYLGEFKRKRKNYKKEFYQAGELFAKLHEIIDANPELIEEADEKRVISLVEQLSTQVKDKFRQADYKEITERELATVISELSMKYDSLPKGNVLYPDCTLFSIHKKKVRCTESVYDVKRSYGSQLEDLCYFIAQLASGKMPFGKNIPPKRMKTYFIAMCEGYDSVRQLSKEEKEYLKPILQGYLLVEMAEHLPYTYEIKDLVKFYGLV